MTVPQALPTEPPEWPENWESESLGGAPPQAEREKTCPFPGPRSFKETEKDFFVGRTAEARDLLSLLVASPITLLYSPSGAGKTSLVQTKLVQLLDEREYAKQPIARVGGFQATDAKNPYIGNAIQSWGGDPARALSLPSFIGSLGAARDRDGDPTLRVAVFDQFEELFTTHRANSEARREFFEQLAEALTQNRELRVLLLLREEYLAALDPYAAIVPGRMQARMRLERLTEAAAKAAVTAPLRKLGVAISDRAATYICSRLRAVREDGGKEALGDFVEPVQLQVVCRRLWFRLPDGTTRVSQQDVSSGLGDVRAALITFYEDALKNTVLATKRRERPIRNWIGKQLITESRTRGNAFRGPETTAGISNSIVEELDKQLVVRREPRAGGSWYELAHDALIEPILESNDRASARWRRRILLATLLPVPLLLAVGLFIARALFKPIGPSGRAAINTELASEFWPATDASGTASNTAEAREAILQQLRGLPAPSIESLFPPVAAEPHSGSTPFVIRLRYKSGTLNAGRLEHEWLQRARALERKGYAGPSSFVLEGTDGAQVDKFGLDLVRVDPEAASTPLKQASTPREGSTVGRAANVAAASPQNTVPSTPGAPGGVPTVAAPATSPAHSGGRGGVRTALFGAFEVPVSDIHEPVLLGALPPELATPTLAIQAVEARSDSQGKLWFKIPAWSWPIFSFRPGLLRPPEALLVDELYAAVASRDPELFIAEPWLPHLIKYALTRNAQPRAAQDFARSLYFFPCPTALLAALNRTAKGFATLPDAEALFDETFEREQPTAGADSLESVRGTMGSRARSTSSDPTQCPANALYPSWRSMDAAIRNDDLFVPPAGSIRVALGPELASALTTSGERLRDEVLENLDELQQGVFERTGVTLAQAVLSTDNHLQPNQFRVETLEEVPLEWSAAPLVASPETAIQAVSAAVAARLKAAPERWIDLATVRELERELPAEVRAELQAWPAADLVRILKYALAPAPAVPENCPIDVAVGAGTTLHEPSWVLPTLAVWRALSPAPECAARGLRALEARRSQKPSEHPTDPLVSANRTVALLAAGHAGDAAKVFGDDYRARGKPSVEEFLTAYAKLYDKRRDLDALLGSCSLGPRSSHRAFGQTERYKLGLFANDPQVPADSRKQLKLCELQTLGDLEFNRRAGNLAKELSGSLEKEPQSWLPDERAVLAYWHFDTALPRATIPEVFEMPQPPKLELTALEETSDALAKTVSAVDSRFAFLFLNDAWSSCAMAGRTTRFCSRLPAKFSAELPDSMYVALNAGVLSARIAYNEDSERVAQEQIERAARHIAGRDWSNNAWLDLARLQAGAWRWGSLDVTARAKAENALWELAQQLRARRSAAAPEPQAVAELAVTAASYSRDPKHVDDAIKRARALSPADAAWDVEDFKLALWTGKSARVSDIIRHSVGTRIPDGADLWAVPVALAAALMPESLNARQFQNAGISNAYPMHAQLLAAYGHGKGQTGPEQELTPVWTRIKPNTWAERLEQDATVWGELLLGDFMGSEDARRLLEPIEHDPASSPLSALGMTPAQLRCELYFYRALRRRIDPSASEEEVRQLLKRVVDTGEAQYYEFAAAQFLLLN